MRRKIYERSFILGRSLGSILTLSQTLHAFVKWEQCCNTIMDATRRFPKALRPTLARRIDDACISAFVLLSEVRYLSKEQKPKHLSELDRQLSTVRALLRLAQSREAISRKTYLHLSELVDEVGRMVGGLNHFAQS